MAEPRAKRTALTPKRVRELFDYNKSSGVLTWKLGKRAGKRAGFECDADMRDKSKKRRRVWIDRRQYYEHVLIWIWVKGRWPVREIDHEDTDATNNRWKNLRLATSAQNKHNSRTNSRNTTGFKWVRAHHRGKYQATVQITLGVFSRPDVAHAAAARFVKKVHKQFFNPGGSRAAGQGARL